MIELRVQYLAQLRTARGVADESCHLPEGATLAQLLTQLAGTHGAEVAKHLYAAAGVVQPSLMIAVNGTAISVRQSSQTLLRSGDVVTLMPPIAGG
ncbi:MAG: MoaD/ThiS family protein [Planctomycetaceae bacterium]|nr:MoaD/ThiS family protein [Planctomycetaceae bacterium]